MMIASADATMIIAVLLTLLAAALALERTPLGKVLPGPAIMLVGAVALTNLNILPHQSPAYTELTRFAVPVGVFLLLLRANIRQIMRETGTLLALYLVGAATSIVGILVAFVLVPVPEIAKIAAVQTANLVGGTVNVIAVSSALQLDSTTLTAMLAGGAPVMTLYLMITGLMNASPALNRFLPERRADIVADAPEPDQSAIASPEDAPRPARVEALQLATVLAMAVMTYAISAAALARFGLGQYLIIVVTLVALLVANLAPRQVSKLSGDREIGTMLMYLFFASLGVDVDLASFGEAALFMALFIALAMVVHMVLLLLAARLMKAGLAETLVGSIAGVAGPTTAAAMAASFGRRSLITPGILCGLLGFATATFVAMTLYGLLPG
ncbi:hypothetical protein sos41_40520 [Alphaproteobacteria bacterium SO-S41]|nr:hypothetical protein sos41_40520 [Alphaproteobacteria bacterium SO-S41]